jgi:hypothetical protein
MSKPEGKGSPFAKVITVLAVAFGVGLGLCGLNAVLISTGVARNSSGSFARPIFSIVGVSSLAVMILSAMGLVITTIVWVLTEIIGNLGFRRGDDEPQRLFDDKDSKDFKD